MGVLHIVPGTDDIANGMVVVANLLAKEQGNEKVIDLRQGIRRIYGSDVEEVWVHGMWLPREWVACSLALKAGKRLVRMTHGSLSPVYLTQQSSLKKKLVSPIERYFLRRANRVVATCEAERKWIRAYEPGIKEIEVTDLKRFFDFSHKEKRIGGTLHLLYLGRRHKLKGVEYIESCVNGLKNVDLRVVSDAAGEEKKLVWEWCDVLVLPTLSENFGLVIAEALARGKRVITTDGAPAWGGDNNYGGRLIYIKGFVEASDSVKVALLKGAIESLQTINAN